MKTKILVIIIMVIVTFILISFTMPNLSKVYGSCEMIQDDIIQPSIGYQWSNGILYIDNAECTWKLFGIVPIASLLSEDKEHITKNTDDHTVYSHPFAINSQNIESQLNVDPQYIKNPHNSVEVVLDIDAMI